MARKKNPANGKPELDDGYLRIANELWQALIDYDFTAMQMKIIAVIIRETYGYNRKSKDLSVSYLAKGTRSSKVGVSKALNDLINKKVIVEYESNTNRKAREIGINKYYLDWARVQPERTLELTTVVCNQSEPQSVTTVNPRVQPERTKPIQYKDNIKDNKPTASDRNYSAVEEEYFGGW